MNALRGRHSHDIFLTFSPRGCKYSKLDRTILHFVMYKNVAQQFMFVIV
jgi:hypothetical protein